MDTLGFYDWVVFALVLGLTFFLVFLGHILPKKNSGSKGFVQNLLLGRALTMPMFVATTVSTLFGSFFGVTQFAYEKGVYNLMTQGIFWYPVYIVAAIFIVPRIRSTQVPQTLADYLREKYGPVSEKVGAIFNFIDIVPITYAIGLGVFIKTITGVSHTMGMCTALIFVILYSAFGRFRAVIFSDILQCAIMYLCILFVIVYSFKLYGVEVLFTNLPQKHWTLFPESWSLTFIWGSFALATLTDPNLYHRCFSAKSTKDAQRGILISTVFWFIFDLMTTAGGMYARAIMPNCDPQDAYLNYALHVLPNPLRGMMLAGIFTTVLSAIDTYLFIGSTTLFKNLLPNKHREKCFIKYLGMVIIGTLAAVLAYSFDGSIYNIWKTLGSLSTACLLAPLMMGIFSKRKISDLSFAYSCIFGVCSLTFWKYLPRPSTLHHIDEFYVGLTASTSGILFAHLKIIFIGLRNSLESYIIKFKTFPFDFDMDTRIPRTLPMEMETK